MLYSFKFYGYIIEVGKGKCYEMNADHQGLTFKRQKWDDGSAEFEQHLAHPPEGYDFSMALSYMYGNLWPQEDPNEEKFWSQGIFEAKKYNTIVSQQGLHLLHFFDSFENIYMTTHFEDYLEAVYKHFESANCIFYKTLNPIDGTKFEGKR